MPWNIQIPIEGANPRIAERRAYLESAAELRTPGAASSPGKTSPEIHTNVPSNPEFGHGTHRGGFLITFEGIGGSGKSTLARLLLEQLSRVGWDVRASRGSQPLASAFERVRAATEQRLAARITSGPVARR